MQNTTDQPESRRSIQANASGRTWHGRHARRSQRLMKAISQVPVFSFLKEEELDRLTETAQVVVADRGRTIIRQGGQDRSMYIILDGKVRVFTRDTQGKQIHLAILSENEFFGEIASLKGVPRTATVQALEEALLCRLDFVEIQRIVEGNPSVRAGLESYYRGRLDDTAAKKQAQGCGEEKGVSCAQRGLPVEFSVSAVSRTTEEFRGKVFRCVSTNISTSGVRVKVQDFRLQELPVGCQLRLAITLPQPWGSIRCLGSLSGIFEDGEVEGFLSVGIDFSEMLPDHRDKLEQFLRP